MVSGRDRSSQLSVPRRRRGASCHRLCSPLAAADWVEFAFIRDRLDLSDSALSKQRSTLEAAGCVALERQLNGRRHHLRARLTPAGRSAFDGHVEALRQIVNLG